MQSTSITSPPSWTAYIQAQETAFDAETARQVAVGSARTWLQKIEDFILEYPTEIAVVALGVVALAFIKSGASHGR